MTKIAEKHAIDDGKLHIVETHDFNPILDKAAALRAAGKDSLGESRLVGMIPMALWAEWARKWGVSPSDNDAMREVVAWEMANPDNAHFRVWEGKFR